ncbi:MAG: phosphoenolpyruvate synthase [Bacillota bacterium]
MHSNVVFLNQLDRTHLLYAGGKGANLGELSKAGFPVPGGFCITTSAYQEFISGSSEMNSLFEELNTLNPADLNQLRDVSQRIRTHISQLETPKPLQEEILDAWNQVGKDFAYAVRSSATAEDLPTASFAGQQDTYLNIKGSDELLKHVQKCWASLFTDRAIAYRAKNGFDHRLVYLSVVVQRMVHPEISGILFTADPINGNRTVVTIDASFGLGEAIVSGMVSADLYKVKANQIIQKDIAEKKLAIYSLPEGGTITKELRKEEQTKQALTKEQIFRLVSLGKQIEQHFISPQDIEFCIENEEIFVVQSRPITSLYPLPANIPHEPLGVMFSFGHFQMMTDAMKPLGISVIKTIFITEINHLLLEAGSRIYINLTEGLRHKFLKKIIPKFLINIDEAISRAVQEVIQRPEFLATPAKLGTFQAFRQFLTPVLKEVAKNLLLRDPQLAKEEVEDYMQKRWEQVRTDLQGIHGDKRIETVKKHLDTLVFDVFKKIIPKVVPFIITSALLKNFLNRWMGDDRELHKLNQSLPGNVTSEMGLQIGDLADIVREFPEVEAYLENTNDQTFFDGLSNLRGGEIFTKAFGDFIDKYGSRCPGEIDITNPRWYETPTALVAPLLGHMRSVKSGEHRLKFTNGEKAAQEAEQTILQHVKGNPLKTRIMERLIKVFRHLGGLREHHKYLFTLIMAECKKAIIAEAEELVNKGVIKQVEDVYFFTLEEVIQLTKGEFNTDVDLLLENRKAEYEWHQTLPPPRVMTSEGEIVVAPPKTGSFPKGSLVGSPVSAGVAVGRARIVLRPEEASLHEGEILVAPFTDPGWTPLFQSAKALVTEVGGLMTHGSVVAREYGIPAVVGIDDATKKIQDGQMIRVDGNQGFVEFLSKDD